MSTKPLTPGQILLLARDQWEEENPFTGAPTVSINLQRMQDKCEFMANAVLSADPERKNLIEALREARKWMSSRRDRRGCDFTGFDKAKAMVIAVLAQVSTGEKP